MTIARSWPIGGLTDEGRDALNRIAAQEAVDPEELEEALTAAFIREVNSRAGKGSVPYSSDPGQ